MTIVPRWEWRTFGESFAGAEQRLAALSPESVRESDELYLLSTAADDSVKVRDELLDVKQLEQVSDDGLEQWRPVLKAPFPLSAATVDSVLAALHASPPPQGRSAYTLDELVEEVVRPSRQLAAVAVHKRRAHYTVSGCMAELTDVLFDPNFARNHYIFASAWEGTPFTASYRRAQARGWSTSEIACGHDVMLDDPEALTAELLGAAGAAGPVESVIRIEPPLPH